MPQQDINDIFLPIGISVAFSSLWGIVCYALVKRKFRIMETQIERLEGALARIQQPAGASAPYAHYALPPAAQPYMMPMYPSAPGPTMSI